MSPKPVYLDVDPSIVERSLKITENPNEAELNKIFSQTDQYPSRVVKPFPGFCIKSREIGTEIKIFVNICHTDAIPPPKNILEEELVQLCDSDEPSEFKIPMSIGEVRSESDKKGNKAKVIDVAIHPTFFDQVENSSLFKNFLIAVAFDGLKNKHKLHTTDERILLKNRKAYGTLQLHRIQQRDVEQKMNQTEESDKSVYNELIGQNKNVKPKPKIETLSSVTFEKKQNKNLEYRLFRKLNELNYLIGEFKLPNVFDIKEVNLDMGEDRIILESDSKGYFLDVFLPWNIIQEKSLATFNKNTKILTATMSIRPD